MKILDYIPEDAEIGVGLALRLRTGEYMFMLPGDRHISDTSSKELFYAGVGGHLELGETLLECGRREAKEEIGLEIEYISSTVAAEYIDSNKIRRSIEVKDEIIPLAIFEMIHPLGSPRSGMMYHIVIFNAIVDRVPTSFQDNEVRGILLLTDDQVRKGNRRATVQQLLNEGASIIGRNIEQDTILYPIGTAEALAII